MAAEERALESLEVGRLPDRAFWACQRVFLTGHSGFKGTWLSLWLEEMGAEVYGLSLPPSSTPNLFDLVQPFRGMTSEFGDIRNIDLVRRAVQAFRPSVTLHLAAQPLVRRSYRDPLNTFSTNVMGTAHVLDALRGSPGLKTILVVTTDKVYSNPDAGRPFIESDVLGGHDPYSASKAAAELTVASWAHSFLHEDGIAVATARAGNVVGGGDWSEDRLIPDVLRALKANRPVELRYPNATRPWQHVLEPLAGYLVFAEALTENPGTMPTALNFGPLAKDEVTVSQVAEIIAGALGLSRGWVPAAAPDYKEMKSLSLDASLATASLGWRPALNSAATLAWTAEWYRSWSKGNNPRAITLNQLRRYAAQ